uniref:Uncharacterized protein n=1 Tax=Timema tahoe TaxID=61484 RepID=A0A7R9IN53_9NEOP|nr:unnamed protein product [Timema tahoe]
MDLAEGQVVLLNVPGRTGPVNTSDAIMLTTLLSVLVLVAVEGTIEPLDEGKKQVLWTIRGTNQDTYRGATVLLHSSLDNTDIGTSRM